jgi:ubiquinone/menaquinone biosynthesis C-methylase UbiE
MTDIQTNPLREAWAAPTPDHPDGPDAWKTLPTLQELKSHAIWGLRRAFLERLWPDVHGWKVLEVGSGPAHDSLTLAERGAHVTALDYSEIGLELANQFYHSLGLPIRTVKADATALPFPDGEFDLAFNAGVLEHFTDSQLEKVIDEMVRVVRPGGYVLAFCPNRYNIFYQHHLRRVTHHAYDFERAFTAAEMRKRFALRGLSEIRLSGVLVHPTLNYLLPSWLPKHHRIEPISRGLFGWLERMQRFHRLKSIIGQDFVIWAPVLPRRGEKKSLAELSGGPDVREHAVRIG